MPDATDSLVTVYYDYTCQYSYRALGWMDLVAAARPGFEAQWATFSLKEVNRAPEDPSFVEPGGPSSISVLALALGHAARAADFTGYHHAVFDAMHEEQRKLDEADLLQIAADAGVDTAAFETERDAWIARAGEEHRDGVARWGVFGTPTVVLGGSASYIRIGAVPESPTAAAQLLESLDGLARSPATLVEFNRPEAPKPVHHVLPIDFMPPPGLG